jgi:hypothetical protein
MSGSACVYQQDPNIGVPNVMSLAWFAKAANPNTKLMFQWDITYNFVWSQTGVLIPGVIFWASETVNADLSQNNKISFSYQNNAFTFKKPPTQGSQIGTIYIEQDGTIPANTASVGVGMSGSGTFAVQAQPNVLATFTPHPEYWITFGNYHQGQVMDVGTITKAAKIDFPPNVYAMTATLKPDNTWLVTQGIPSLSNTLMLMEI